MGFRGRWRRHGHHLAAVPGALSDLPPGAEGTVTEVTGSTQLASRLRELGLVPGVRIRVLRAACPLVVQVGEGRFCLRRVDAASIRVCPEDRRLACGRVEAA